MLPRAPRVTHGPLNPPMLPVHPSQAPHQGCSLHCQRPWRNPPAAKPPHSSGGTHNPAGTNSRFPGQKPASCETELAGTGCIYSLWLRVGRVPGELLLPTPGAHTELRGLAEHKQRSQAGVWGVPREQGLGLLLFLNPRASSASISTAALSTGSWREMQISSTC